MNPALLSLLALLVVVAASLTSRVNVGVLAVALAWGIATFAVDWKVEGQYILSGDDAPLEIRYVVDVTDPNSFDPLFIEAFECKLPPTPLPAALRGALPIEFVSYKRDTSTPYPLGLSLVSDAAAVGRAIYNYLSWAQEIHRHAGFPFLALPMAATGGQMDPQTRVSVGPTRALPYSADTGAPSYVQPSSESTRELREHCVFLFQAALRTAGLEMSADASAQVQSGEALRIRSRDFESRAKRFARNLERYETRMLSLLARFAGVADPQRVTYAERFALPDPTSDLANALKLLTDCPVEMGVTAKTAAVRVAVKAALSLSDADLARVMDEVGGLFEADALAYAERQRTPPPSDNDRSP